ncbi:hypothetical protein AYL99_11833 [Fonsecaea erecta]|uniref:Chromo domain-containing protein n=1 Tax=Fonsecaea erecta TaxID=1367422 RepID=A0A178Z430_9EURO|nr:hypothetical protein AYL99_11833 [Fonsecaea erecta]OAP53953.1 hypothetical protein AYL99_11833 [Fonsecaea erecta]
MTNKRSRSESSTHGSTPRKRPERRSENPASPEVPGSILSASDESIDESERLWPVEKLRNHRGKRNKYQYLVQWAPNPDTAETYDPTWEPEENIADDLIQPYWAEKKAKKQQIKERKKSRKSQKQAERERKSENNTPSRRSEQEKDANEQPDNPSPGQAATHPQDCSKAKVDLILSSRTGFWDEADDSSDHWFPPTPTPAGRVHVSADVQASPEWEALVEFEPDSLLE